MKIYTNTINNSALLLVGLSLVAMTSCSEDDDDTPALAELEGATSLIIDARFGDEDFELHKAFQTTSDDMALDYNFSKLRYWVSNLTLISESGEEYLVPNSFYLMEETSEIEVQDASFGKVYPANKREEIELANIPAGNYTAIKFNIGVEPKYNDNLSLPMQMKWGWTSLN